MDEGDPTYAKRHVLHDTAHTTQSRHRLLGLIPALLQQVLNAAIRIDLHGAQIGVPVYQPRLFAKLLAEGVGQVVGRIGADQQYRFANLGHLDRERA